MSSRISGRSEPRWTPAVSVAEAGAYVASGPRHGRNRRRPTLKRIARQQLLFRVGSGAMAATLLLGTGAVVGATSVSAGTSPLTSHVVSMADFSTTASRTLDTHVTRNITPALGKDLNAALSNTSSVAVTVPERAADALSDAAALANSTGVAVATSRALLDVAEDRTPGRNQTQTSASRSANRSGASSGTTSAQYAAPIIGATITSGYAMRWGRMHNGMDFSAPIGHNLNAVGSGTVTTGYSANGLGKNVRILLDDGTEVAYGHMSQILVSSGMRVQTGDVIGRVGNTGRSTGPHLHFEVRKPDGDRVNPHGWLRQRGLIS